MIKKMKKLYWICFIIINYITVAILAQAPLAPQASQLQLQWPLKRPQLRLHWLLRLLHHGRVGDLHRPFLTHIKTRFRPRQWSWFITWSPRSSRTSTRITWRTQVKEHMTWWWMTRKQSTTRRASAIIPASSIQRWRAYVPSWLSKRARSIATLATGYTLISPMGGQSQRNRIKISWVSEVNW